MRKSSLMLAVFLTGCGGTSPEVYQLFIETFSLPDSCYTSMMQPSSVTTAEQLTPVSVQVWDGPDNTAFLQVESGSISVDMGAAPNVSISGVFTGKKVDKGWTFSADNSVKQTQTPSGNVTTSSTHAEITFERTTTFKGTGQLSSSTNCVGTTCSGTNPSCQVSGLVLSGTRVAVQYERAP